MIPDRRRAGMVVGGLAILLTIIVLGLLTWKTYAQLSVIPDQAFGAANLRADIITRNVVFALAILALAGGVGGAVYLMANRSLPAAQASICVPLALAAGVLGYQAYRTYSGPGAATVTTSGPLFPTPPVPAVVPRTVPSVAERPPRIPTPAPPPLGMTPPAAAQPGTPAVTEPAAPPKTLANRPWSEDPSHRDPPTVAASLADAGDPARATLDTLARELSADIDSVLAGGVDLDHLLARPLPTTKPALKDRIDLAESLQTRAAALAERLRGLRSQVDSTLRSAGVDEVSCSVVAGRFSEGVDGWKRAIAADDIARAASATVDFHRLLHDNTGKWQVNSQGTITTRERSLDSRVFMTRTSFDHARDRLMPALRTLAASDRLPEPSKK